MQKLAFPIHLERNFSSITFQNDNLDITANIAIQWKATLIDTLCRLCFVLTGMQTFALTLLRPVSLNFFIQMKKGSMRRKCIHFFAD